MEGVMKPTLADRGIAQALVLVLGVIIFVTLAVYYGAKP